MRPGLRQVLRGIRDRHREHSDWGDLFREPPPRADRGTVRYLVLDALRDQPHHGYEVLRLIGEKSGGVYRPSPGVIYPTLQMLEELGHVQTTTRGERRVYALAADGKADLGSHAEEVREFYESSSDHGLGRSGDDLRSMSQRFRRLMHLVKRTARRGRLTPTQARRVRAILDQAIAQLEELLEGER